MRTVVVGAGIGGLATALRLGRGGHEVVLVDRDHGPPNDAERAFGDWDRRGVTQWRQYHIFLARARVELERSMPDVLERLREVGVQCEAGDEFAGLPVRRAVLEWVLRHEVETSSDVEVCPGTGVESLIFDEPRSTVTGVRIDGGAAITADLVVDAGGRRSPVGGWVTQAGYDRPTTTRMSCGIAYYTRYYETLPGIAPPSLGPSGVELSDHGFMGQALAIGDSNTLGAIFVVPSTAPEFRALGTTEGWNAAVSLIPRLTEVLDENLRRPIMDPAAMYGLNDVLSPWYADGEQGPRRLAHLGDSWLTTNPNQALGSSVALSQANTLADAVDDHGSDLDSAVEDYRCRANEEVEQLFDMGRENDRALQRRWQLPSEPPSAEELDHEALIFSLGRLAKHGNIDAAIRLGRRQHLLELPETVWSDHDLIRTARDELQRVPFDPNRRANSLDRNEFLATVNAASTSDRA